MPAESKTQLYNRMLSSRDELRLEDVERMSEEIERRVLGMHEFRTALRIGLYAVYKNEVRTDRIFVEGDKHRKEIYYPAIDVEKGGLSYFRVMHLNDLLHTEKGFHEPSSTQSRLRDLGSLDVLIVPGVAFDIKGRRMGFGQGFYDNCLKGFRGRRVALAYDFQVVLELPSVIRESTIDWIVTERRVIRCQ
ncbi:MAG: 5-formyltetrahydrofolate cyclo-ligase [Pseudomonadota bacterium]